MTSFMITFDLFGALAVEALLLWTPFLVETISRRTSTPQEFDAIR